jgi:hypothetical protein
MPSPRILPAALAASVALAVPAGAHAATLTSDGAGAYTFTAGPGEVNHLDVQGTDGGDVVFYGNLAVADPLPASCAPSGIYGNEVVTCSAPARVTVSAGDGDDILHTSSTTPNVPIVIDAGDGKDLVEGDKNADEIHGGGGNDTIKGGYGKDLVDGGDGNDVVVGGGDADQVLGGAGDDELEPDAAEDPSADVVDGGPGVDRIEADYSSRFSSAPAPFLAFTLAGGADDGRPGEGDDIRNVERLTLHNAAKVIGTDASEYVKLHQVGGNGELIGNGGDDELRGGDGADKLDGGTGNDVLDGGFGDDVIVGGPGKDMISADLAGGNCGPLWCKYPFGNDTIDARDGEVDSITCGAGADTVKADAADVVAPDCETVDRAGTAPASGGGATPGGGTIPAGHAVAKLAGGAKLRTALRSGFKVRVTGMGAGRLRLSARRGGAVVARGSATVGASGSAIVRLSFTKAARKALRGKRAVTLKIAGGGLSATVTLRR